MFEIPTINLIRIMNKKIFSFLSAGLLIGAAPAALQAQSIVHHAGSADWTFFYDSVEGTFDVVFRNKSGAVAEGLTSPITSTRRGAGDDYAFDNITVRLTQAPQLSFGSTDYYVSPRNGEGGLSLYDDSSNEPDFGIRTRFEETIDGVNVAQFSSFTMTLDWATSTRPIEAEFVLFSLDELDQPFALFDTASASFSSGLTTYGHNHYHWGFSQQGEYALNFTFVGELAGGGFTEVGSSTVNFEVIPEPGTVALLFGLGALGLVSVYRLRRSKVSA